MVDVLRKYLDDHIAAAAALRELLPEVERVGRALCDALGAGGKVLAFGNGGSAADAQHFTAELVGRFRRDRRSLPAVALTVDPSAMTSISNDYGFADVFARQVAGLCGRGDVVIGISTSGNSENVLRAFRAAKEAGGVTVALLGGTGGKLKLQADHAVVVPPAVTSHVQEMHITVIHMWCEIIDRWAAGE